MTISNFSKLSFREQMVVMLYESVEIANRKDSFNRYFLYQHESFYIEGKFHVELRAVQGIKCFVASSDLDIYLDQIDIHSLFF